VVHLEPGLRPRPPKVEELGGAASRRAGGDPQLYNMVIYSSGLCLARLCGKAEEMRVGSGEKAFGAVG
jgi:hypothetical protein